MFVVYVVLKGSISAFNVVLRDSMFVVTVIFDANCRTLLLKVSMSRRKKRRISTRRPYEKSRSKSETHAQDRNENTNQLCGAQGYVYTLSGHARSGATSPSLISQFTLCKILLML